MCSTVPVIGLKSKLLMQKGCVKNGNELLQELNRKKTFPPPYGNDITQSIFLAKISHHNGRLPVASLLIQTAKISKKELFD